MTAHTRPWKGPATPPRPFGLEAPRIRRNKFNAVRTTVDGITFDSKGEARRYSQLLLLQKGGFIRNLERQVKFPVIINGRHICDYRADFVYFEGCSRIVEDFKGRITAEYRLKKKLVEALYFPLKITEVRSA